MLRVPPPEDRRLTGPVRLLNRPLPTPPESLRLGPLRDGAFPSPLHSPATAVRIGRWLGPAFGICFLTGLISHYAQNPQPWLPIPASHSWGYRLTQGVHVATGLASIPLLLVKLWTVGPRLWHWPPVRSLAHAVERASVAVLVAGALFQVTTGLLNIVQWYPWRFSFTVTHYWVSWVTIGALLVHLAVQAPHIAAHWRARREPDVDSEGMSRRGLLVATGTAVGAVTVATIGQTVRPLAALSVLAPRDPRVGSQGLPVNRTAAAARVATVGPSYVLDVRGPRPFSLDLAALEALPRRDSRLAITCVEGWSAGALWTGVPLRDLLDRPASTTTPGSGSCRWSGEGPTRRRCSPRRTRGTRGPCSRSNSTARDWPSTTVTRPD